MNQEQDLMSRMKRLKRIEQEGGSMNPEETTWFEEAKKDNNNLNIKAKISIIEIKKTNTNSF